MRRAVVLLAVMGVALVLASGVALAVSKTGTNGDDVLKGTAGTDTLAGGGGDDRLYGFARRDRLYGDSGADKVFGNTGPDQLFGGQGFDRVFADGGADFINAIDEIEDPVIDCGASLEDEAYVDFKDVENVSPNCEGLAAVEVVSDPSGQCAHALARVVRGEDFSLAEAQACTSRMQRIR